MTGPPASAAGGAAVAVAPPAVPGLAWLADLPSLDPVTGLALLFAVMAVQVVVPPIPAEIIVVAAGRVFGVGATTLVAGAGLFVGSTLAYAIGYWLRGRCHRRLAGARAARLLAQLRRYGTWLLWVRILPYNPADAISYAAGLLRLETRTFLAVTAATAWVRCLSLAWLGTTLTDARAVLQAAFLLAASAALAHFLVYRRRGGGVHQAGNE